MPLNLLVPVDRAEQDEEDDREQEGEERRLAAAPEEQLLGPELVDEESRHASSSVTSR